MPQNLGSRMIGVSGVGPISVGTASQGPSMLDRRKSFTTTCTLVVVLVLFLFGVVMCLPGLYAEIAPGITKLFEQR